MRAWHGEKNTFFVRKTTKILTLFIIFAKIQGLVSFIAAHVAQLAEHVLGKDEVTGSIPVVGLKAIKVKEVGKAGEMKEEELFCLFRFIRFSHIIH